MGTSVEERSKLIIRRSRNAMPVVLRLSQNVQPQRQQAAERDSPPHPPAISSLVQQAIPDTIHAWHRFYQQVAAGRQTAAVGAFIRSMSA
jgi:hypothetical protein